MGITESTSQMTLLTSYCVSFFDVTNMATDVKISPVLFFSFNKYVSVCIVMYEAWRLICEGLKELGQRDGCWAPSEPVEPSLLRGNWGQRCQYLHPPVTPLQEWDI